jgi:hypothetical protein
VQALEYAEQLVRTSYVERHAIVAYKHSGFGLLSGQRPEINLPIFLVASEMLSMYWWHCSSRVVIAFFPISSKMLHPFLLD